MALEKQTANVNLTGSLDTKTEAFTVEASGMLVAENVDYEFPNKLIKQKGLDDFSKDIAITYGTVVLPLEPFSTDHAQGTLLKNNDTLGVVPSSSEDIFLAYDKIDDLFKAENGNFPTKMPLTITDSFNISASEISTGYTKAYISHFAISQFKDIEMHAISTFQYGIEVTYRSQRFKNSINIGTIASQVKCVIYDTALLPESDVKLITVYTDTGSAQMRFKWTGLSLIDKSPITVPLTPTANIHCFEVFIYASHLYIVLFDNTGSISVVRYLITSGGFTHIANYSVVPPLPLYPTRPFLQISRPLNGKVGIFYFDTNRFICHTRFNMLIHSFDILPTTVKSFPSILPDAPPYVNQPLGLGVGSYEENKYFIAASWGAEVIATGELTNDGYYQRTYLYHYNANPIPVVDDLYYYQNLGAPTRIEIKSLGGTTYRTYFGVSSGHYRQSTLHENDLILSGFFDTNGYSPFTTERPSPIARFNNLSGYGAYNLGLGYHAYGAKALENGRELVLKGDGLNVGALSVTLREYSDGSATYTDYPKIYDYKFYEFSETFDLSNVKFQQYNMVIGAYPSIFNGIDMVYMNTSVIPYLMQASPVLAAGTIPVGSYSICYYMEYVNSNGDVERSPISNIKQVTVIAPNNTITLFLKDEVFISSYKNPSYKVYMTQNAGTVFYLVKSSLTPISGLDILKVPATTSEILYTQGGVLESQFLPPITFAHNAKSRLFVINGEDQNEILFSNKIIQRETPSFNGLLSLRIDSENSARNDFFTAISSMDDKVILFKRSNIFYFYGDGPNELGTGGSFTESFKISTDVGCSEPRSMVQTPLGVMFKSLKGYYLLARDLTLLRIGEPIESFATLPCNMATLLEKKNEVRFLTDDLTLVYNYEFNKWAIVKYGGKDATLFDDDYYILRRSPNALFKLSDTGFLDTDGNPLMMRIVTPWYKVNQIQDFGRFYHAYILGRFKSAHKLMVKVYYNYDDTYSDDFTLSPLVTDSQYQYRVNIPRQKCESIKFEIYDDNQSGTNESMELIDLTFTVGLKKGTYKINAERRY